MEIRFNSLTRTSSPGPAWTFPGRDAAGLTTRSGPAISLHHFATAQREHEDVNGQEVIRAVEALIALDDDGRAGRAAAELPNDLAVADLLRAADGAQRLARALTALRRPAVDDTWGVGVPASAGGRSTYS
jgi:hypothetical protein